MRALLQLYMFNFDLERFSEGVLFLSLCTPANWSDQKSKLNVLVAFLPDPAEWLSVLAYVHLILSRPRSPGWKGRHESSLAFMDRLHSWVFCFCVFCFRIRL
jgi:hypothetical protein